MTDSLIVSVSSTRRPRKIDPTTQQGTITYRKTTVDIDLTHQKESRVFAMQSDMGAKGKARRQ